MNLDQIKKDIDKVVKDYKENWDNHHDFPDDSTGRLANSFRNAQVYRAMFWMARIDISRQDIKNPVVSPSKGIYTQKEFEGLGLVFTWEYGNPNDEEDYVCLELYVVSEGDNYLDVKYHGECWDNSFQKMKNSSIMNLGEILEGETERRAK